MAKVKDISGEVFGKVKVVSFLEMRKDHAYFNCICSCGTKIVARGSHLRCGQTKSCGCYGLEVYKSKEFREKARKNQIGKTNSNFIHGETNTHLYRIFQGIRCRCNVKTAGNYKRYGGVGIKCEWVSFFDFKKDMESSYLRHVNKYGKKQTTIDRIDVNGNYSKENCRWATYSQQASNRRPKNSVKLNM